MESIFEALFIGLLLHNILGMFSFHHLMLVSVLRGREGCPHNLLSFPSLFSVRWKYARMYDGVHECYDTRKSNAGL
jgi:hypothetical protein